MTHQEITTILGRGSTFEGKLTFEGTVRIDGSFIGEIRSDGTLVIGENADIRADIFAGSVVVAGSIHGDIVATHSIELTSTSRMFGDLGSPSIAIERGAAFEGTCRMETSAIQRTTSPGPEDQRAAKADG